MTKVTVSKKNYCQWMKQVEIDSEISLYLFTGSGNKNLKDFS